LRQGATDNAFLEWFAKRHLELLEVAEARTVDSRFGRVFIHF